MSDARDLERFGWGPRPPGPWRPPTGVWPPCPPGPPGPWPGGLFRLEQCWDDVKATKDFLKRIIDELIAEDPSLIGLAQPIIGVTDGSDAQPGQVGEYVRFQAGVTVPAISQTTQVTLGVLPPGDWDCWAWLTDFSVPVTTAQFYRAPPPPGFDDPLNSVTFTAGDAMVTTLVSVTTRALTSAPSLINFTVTTNNVTPGPADGGAVLVFQSRRRR